MPSFSAGGGHADTVLCSGCRGGGVKASQQPFPCLLVLLPTINNFIQTSLIRPLFLFGGGTVLSFKLDLHFDRIKICHLYQD